jgi:hypothetical protein
LFATQHIVVAFWIDNQDEKENHREQGKIQRTGGREVQELGIDPVFWSEKAA